jgi:acyl dehydratase
MSGSVSMTFSSPPSLWLAYPKMFLAQRPALLPAGREVPTIEARLEGLKARTEHLKAYRRVCGFAAGGKLPITYPHVMAMSLNVVILTNDAFPVRLMGMVHVRNEIESRRPIADDTALDILCRLSGHRETDRGQEFDLVTEAATGGEHVWRETSTFLARRPAPRTSEHRKGSGKPPGDQTPAAVSTTSWHADADIGRRYAAVSGDFNPIHLTDITARLFGFDRAIAHGMWSLARTAAELEGGLAGDAFKLSAGFKLPILLPAWVNLHSWHTRDGLGFSLKDAQGEKPHVTGTFERLLKQGSHSARPG